MSQFELLPTINMQPVVLTDQFAARLARLNAVARCLRELGYRVVHEDARTNTPALSIQPGRTDTLRPLMLLSGGSTQRRDASGRVSSGRVSIDGVSVHWEAAA